MFIEMLGITEADIKDCGWYMDMDMYWVTTWNRRSFQVTGEQVYKWSKNVL